MIQYKYGLLLLLITISISAFSQTSVLSTQSTVIDEERYLDIKGSPYIFKDWIKANVYDKEGELIKDIPVNYNAFDHGMEIKKNGRLTIIDESFYPKIIIKKHKLKKSLDGPLTFVPYKQKNAAKGMYVLEIATSETLSLYKKFRVAKKENQVNTPGQIITQEKFSKYSDFIIFKDGKYIQVKNKVDEFIKHLGHDKELKSFAKKNKIKLKSDQEAKELFEYALTLMQEPNK